MKLCIVRPPTFIAEESYPYNIECVIAALKSDGHYVSFVDAEVTAATELMRRSPSGVREKVLNRMNVYRRVTKQAELVNSLFTVDGDAFWSTIADEILATEPDIIGFSCYTASMSSTVRLINILRDKRGFRGGIMLGGIHPSSAPEETMQRVPGLDYIVIGEGEETVRDLVGVIENNGQLSDVQGICFRTPSSVMRTSPRPLIKDLSTLPVPSFEYVDGNRYRNFVMLTSRGCPFHCHYCASKVVFSKNVRYKPATMVVDEIEKLLEKVPVENLRFGDDTFTVNRKHMSGIAQELKRRDIRLKLSVGSRIDTIDEEKVSLLKEMGVVHISLGIETGSKRIQQMVHKNISLEDVMPRIKMLNQAGIETLTFFIINHPGERSDDMEKSLELIEKLYNECKLNRVSVNTGFPYPATPWWDFCKDNGLLDGIDLYERSHMYNHAMKPAVNMSEESVETLMEYYDRMNSIAHKNRFRKSIQSALKHPIRTLATLRKTIFN